MIRRIIEEIKKIKGVRTAFPVDDRIVVDLEEGIENMGYVYTGKGATTGVVAPNLTAGNTYCIIKTRETPEWDNKTIAIRDDGGVLRWYSPLFIKRSFKIK